MTPEEATTAGIPESAQAWDEVTNSKDANTFWDRMGNMRTKIGTGLYQPGEDADAEAWNKFSTKATELSGQRLMPKPDFENAEQSDSFYASIGRPEEAKGYEFETVEGSNFPDERAEFIRGIAFESGLTKTQLKTMDAKIRKADVATQEAATLAHTEQVKELKQEWGMSYEDRLHQAQKVVGAFFPHLAEDASLSANEMKAFYSIAKQLGTNSTEFTDQGKQHNQSLTPDEASTKISEMRNNKDHPYNNPRDPAHKAAKLKMRNYYLIKNNIQPE